MSVDDNVTKMGYTRQEGYTWKEKDSLYVIVDTWIDGQWQEVDKYNRSYIHVKDGSISADGKTVCSWEPHPASSELMKSGDEDSFCVGKQRKNKVLTLHLTSQQNRYWLRTYSETDENTNSNILS